LLFYKYRIFSAYTVSSVARPSISSKKSRTGCKDHSRTVKVRLQKAPQLHNFTKLQPYATCARALNVTRTVLRTMHVHGEVSNSLPGYESTTKIKGGDSPVGSSLARLGLPSISGFRKYRVGLFALSISLTIYGRYFCELEKTRGGIDFGDCYSVRDEDRKV